MKLARLPVPPRGCRRTITAITNSAVDESIGEWQPERFEELGRFAARDNIAKLSRSTVEANN